MNLLTSASLNSIFSDKSCLCVCLFNSQCEIYCHLFMLLYSILYFLSLPKIGVSFRFVGQKASKSPHSIEHRFKSHHVNSKCSSFMNDFQHVHLQNDIRTNIFAKESRLIFLFVFILVFVVYYSKLLITYRKIGQIAFIYTENGLIFYQTLILQQEEHKLNLLLIDVCDFEI